MKALIVKGNTKKRGFTLIEMIVGMAMAAILAVILGMLLYFNFRIWQANTTATQLQQDAALITNTISKVVRSGSSSTITVPGSGSSSVINVGAAQFYLTGAASPYNLLYRTTSGSVITLVSNEVTSPVFQKDATPSSVAVSMTLTSGNQQVALNFTVGYRN